VINFCQILFDAKTTQIAKKGPTMRVSDDRYTRDRQRLDLALRLIRHEARTFTIRQWTGLSDDRIRKLYRSYVMNHDAERVLRHRGKSPRQAAFFFRNTELNFQSAQLASLYVVYGLLCGTDSRLEPRYRLGSLESGTLLCQAYEAYLELHAPASISFEHAWFLLFALARRDEVGISRCSVCGGVRLRDLLAKHKLSCGTCGPAAAPASKASTTASAPAPDISFAAPC
jgi:Flagellar transcriptional activator (FlhC)